MTRDSASVAPCQEPQLEKLLFDVEDRCGRATRVLHDVRSKVVNEIEADGGWELMVAALEMVTHDLDALSVRALYARTCKEVA